MVGTACWAASMTAKPQPSLRDGSTCTQDCCSTWCLVGVVDVTVKSHRVRDAQPLRMRRPGARTTSRRRRRRDAGRVSSARSWATASSASSICLCGTSRDNTSHPRCRSPAASQRRRRRLVETVAHHGDSTGVDTEVDQVAGRRQRHRHVLVVRGAARGDNHDSTNQPTRLNTRPATGHCSRWQWCTSTTARLP